jgi:hypothetical protein
MFTSKFHRRSFLITAAATSLARSGKSVPWPSDTIRIGVIGCGGRARQVLKELIGLPGVAVPVLCDVDQLQLAKANESLLGGNVSRPPGEWQSYDIVFHGPKCDAEDRLIQPGTLTVFQNGVLVQDHMTIQTKRGCKDKIGDPGSVVLQDHQPKNPPMTVMRFRNIWLRNLGE